MRTGFTTLAAACIVLSGCWADFPDERFNVDAVTAVDQRPDDLATSDRSGPADADAATPDTVPAVDAPPCPAACTAGCQGSTCVMTCDNNCVCPAGWDCQISCGSTGCQGNVDCSQGRNCDVSCGVGQSCTGDITCGSGTCTVACPASTCQGTITCGPGMCQVTCGPGACDTVDCSLSCGCTVACGPAACGTVTCPPACKKCGEKDGCDNC